MTTGNRAWVVFGCIAIAYLLGVLDERWYPGPIAVPVPASEALIWCSALFLCGVALGAAVEVDGD